MAQWVKLEREIASEQTSLAKCTVRVSELFLHKCAQNHDDGLVWQLDMGL